MNDRKVPRRDDYDGVFPLTVGEDVFPLTVGEDVFPLTVGEDVFPLTLKPTAIYAVLGDIAAERIRQDAKWGQQNHPNTNPVLARDLSMTGSVVAEFHMLPTADLARERCDQRHARGSGSWADIAVEELAEAVEAYGDDAHLREELVQLAAVCVAWIECIDRRAP